MHQPSFSSYNINGSYWFVGGNNILRDSVKVDCAVDSIELKLYYFTSYLETAQLYLCGTLIYELFHDTSGYFYENIY